MRSIKAKHDLIHRVRLSEAADNLPPKPWLGKAVSMVGEYFLRNPLALTTAAVLTIGGLVLMGFFLRIGFMPDVDMAGSMALLFAAAIVGVGTLAILIFATVLPGVSMRYLLDHADLPLNWPSLLTTAGPAVLLVTLAVLSPVMLEPSKQLGTWAIVGGCFALALIAATALVAASRRPVVLFDWRAYRRSIWPLMTCTLLWTLGLFQVLKAAIQMGVDSPHPPIFTIFLLGCWLLMIGSINLVMARLPLRVSLVVGPAAGACSVVVLAMLTSSYSTISAITVRTLAIGEIHGTNLVVSVDMCQALSATAGALQCEPLAEKAVVGLLKNVTLVSRIGSNVVVERAPQGSQAQGRPRLVLRKDAVIAWTTPGEK
jgi:hypothetical protein